MTSPSSTCTNGWRTKANADAGAGAQETASSQSRAETPSPQPRHAFEQPRPPQTVNGGGAQGRSPPAQPRHAFEEPRRSDQTNGEGRSSQARPPLGSSTAPLANHHGQTPNGWSSPNRAPIPNRADPAPLTARTPDPTISSRPAVRPSPWGDIGYRAENADGALQRQGSWDSEFRPTTAATTTPDATTPATTQPPGTEERGASGGGDGEGDGYSASASPPSSTDAKGCGAYCSSAK